MPFPAREAPEALVDTSVAVALVLSDHESHKEVIEATEGRRLGLSGHALFETFSVLTRLPPPARLTARAATRAIEVNFPSTRLLGADDAARLFGSLPDLGVSGGAVYDGLVGVAARAQGVRLLTRDARAAATYRILEVEFELIADRLG